MIALALSSSALYIGKVISVGNIGVDQLMIYTSFDNYPIEHSLYGQFITYDELRNIISNEYANDNYSQTINVFIDVYQFLMIGLRYKKINDPYSIAASIINYAAHIRRYFKIIQQMILKTPLNSYQNIMHIIRIERKPIPLCGNVFKII